MMRMIVTQLSTKYFIADTKQKLEELDEIFKDKELLSVDTETNGLLLYKTTIIGFSISYDGNSGCYVPLLEWIPNEQSKKTRKIKGVAYDCLMDGEFRCVWSGNNYPESITPELYNPPEFVTDYLRKWTVGKNLIMHNAPFDVNQIYINYGIDLAPYVFMDTALLSHIINENSSNALKRVADEWRDELGINSHALANQEQKELNNSIVLNGGKGGQVWRANPFYLGKYACADTFLTFGVYEVGMEKFIKEFGEEGLQWLLEDEVMPLCREVVIPMKRRGVYIDEPYFSKVLKETSGKMLELEDEVIEEITPLLKSFSLGKSMDEAVSRQRLVKAVVDKEGLELPIHAKTGKPTMSKTDVKRMYQQDPHWVWGWMLGEDELRYPDEELYNLKKVLYINATGKRHRFNIGSDAHLRWLFIEKLEMDADKLPKTEHGQTSVKAEVLEEFMLKKFPWVHKLLTWKKLRKLNNTYVLPALELNINGYLYMDFRQNGTTSGRFSCSGGFNLQTLPRVEELDKCTKCNSSNITISKPIELLADIKCSDCGHSEEMVLCPSAIKTGFIAPPGYKIVNADFSSLEPRCFAYMSGDNKLKQVYWDNLDLYSKVYCDMEGIPYKDLKKSGMKKERDAIKPVALGIPYGARGPQVANLMGLYDGDRLDVQLGWEKLNLYLDTYSDLRKYMDEREVEAIHKGEVRSLIGRKRHFKFTQYMYLLIRKAGITVTEFLDMPRKRLARINPLPGLNKTELEEFCKRFKIPYESAEEKDYWAMVRGLFKAEMNNAKNFPIQALAAHITNRSMLDTQRMINDAGIDGWVCLQIHDEVGCYIPSDKAEIGAEFLRIGMEENNYSKLIDIPMIAEPTICDNLKDAK